MAALAYHPLSSVAVSCAEFSSHTILSLRDDFRDKTVNTKSGLRQFFRPGGTLASAHPSFELRAGQLEMANAVDAALSENRKLIVEAGTGQGRPWLIWFRRSCRADAW